MKRIHFSAVVLCASLAPPFTAFSQTASSSGSTRLSPLPTGAPALSAPAQRDHFRFVVGGDNRTTGHGDPPTPVFREICREIGLVGPDFVLWTGDTIHGYGDTPGEASQEYTSFLQVAGRCRAPFISVPGNHEKGLEGTALQDVWVRRMGRLYGSFDYGNSHFIGLDRTIAEPGAEHAVTIDPKQFAWLESDLSAHAPNAGNTFVFMHHYVFGPADPDLPDGKDSGFPDLAVRDRLHRLFVQHGVRAVFCGHSHLNWHERRDGVDYFIAGNAGAPLEAPPEQGGYFGYLLVDVDGNKIRTTTMTPWTLLTLSPNRPATGGHGEVVLSNYTHYDLPLRGVRVKMPASPTSTTYRAHANISYKGKTKTAEVQVIATTALPGGGREVILSLTLAHGRTTVISVDASANPPKHAAAN